MGGLKNYLPIIVTTFLLGLTLSNAVYGRDVILVVYGDHDVELSPFSRLVLRHRFERSETHISQNWPQIFIHSLKVSDLERDLELQISERVADGDRILGIVLEGHGNPTQFSLYKKGNLSFSGKKLALLLSQALSKQKLSEKFFVYIHACLTAQCGLPKNFETWFSRKLMRSFLISNSNIEEVTFISHPELSNGSAWEKPTLFEKLAIKSKLATRPHNSLPRELLYLLPLVIMPITAVTAILQPDFLPKLSVITAGMISELLSLHFILHGVFTGKYKSVRVLRGTIKGRTAEVKVLSDSVSVFDGLISPKCESAIARVVNQY